MDAGRIIYQLSKGLRPPTAAERRGARARYLQERARRAELAAMKAEAERERAKMERLRPLHVDMKEYGEKLAIKRVERLLRYPTLSAIKHLRRLAQDPRQSEMVRVRAAMAILKIGDPEK